MSTPVAIRLMRLIPIAVLLQASLLHSAFVPAPSEGSYAANVRLMFEWVQLNYTWPNATVMDEYLADEKWIPQNCIVTGVKNFGSTTYVTVPRWRSGVPSTLNIVVNSTDGTPLLQPFPNWDWQDLNNVAALRYVQSMEITPSGVMWILDVGRLNIFDSDPAAVVNGPPKLIQYDLTADAVVRTFVFTDDVASYSASFLNDIVLDVSSGTAYISDAGTGAIVVYNQVSNSARRFSDASTQANMSTPMVINGISYPTFATPVDGIALSPDRTTLYYCALRGNALYSINTDALRDFTTTNEDLSALVVYHGFKQPSDGLTFTDTGMLYFGSLTGDAIMQWDACTDFATQSVFVSDVTEMQWPDTFAFGEPGQLIFTTNRLQMFFTNTMVWNGSAGANMRVFSVDIGSSARSYMSGQPPFSPPSPCSPDGFTSCRACIVAVSVMTALLVIVVSAVVWRWWRSRAGGAKMKASNQAGLLDMY